MDWQYVVGVALYVLAGIGMASDARTIRRFTQDVAVAKGRRPEQMIGLWVFPVMVVVWPTAAVVSFVIDRLSSEYDGLVKLGLANGERIYERHF